MKNFLVLFVLILELSSNLARGTSTPSKQSYSQRAYERNSSCWQSFMNLSYPQSLVIPGLGATAGMKMASIFLSAHQLMSVPGLSTLVACGAVGAVLTIQTYSLAIRKLHRVKNS